MVPGLDNHMRSHHRGQVQTPLNATLHERYAVYLCACCDKACIYIAGIKRHIIINRDRQVSKIVNTDKIYIRQDCKRGCKSEDGNLRDHYQK